MTVEIVDSLARVAPAEWNRLAGDDPFVSHEFLSALHETGCATPETGWTPRYVLLKDGGALTAALPLYLKDHSYGEYVFDWAWADAYYRNGIDTTRSSCRPCRSPRWQARGCSRSSRLGASA